MLQATLPNSPSLSVHSEGRGEHGRWSEIDELAKQTLESMEACVSVGERLRALLEEVRPHPLTPLALCGIGDTTAGCASRTYRSLL